MSLHSGSFQEVWQEDLDRWHAILVSSPVKVTVVVSQAVSCGHPGSLYWNLEPTRVYEGKEKLEEPLALKDLQTRGGRLCVWP